MAIEFKRSWTDPDLDQFRDTVVRFIEEEMLPDDEAARKRGHVGHDIWRKAGATGLLCTDIPETWGGGGGDFPTRELFDTLLLWNGSVVLDAKGEAVVWLPGQGF